MYSLRLRKSINVAVSGLCLEYIEELLKRFSNADKYNYLCIEKFPSEAKELKIASLLNPLNYKLMVKDDYRELLYEEICSVISLTHTTNAVKNIYESDESEEDEECLYSDNVTLNNIAFDISTSYINDCKKYCEEYYKTFEIEMYDKFDCLSYWQSIQDKTYFKYFEPLIQHYLPIEATEFSCESLFHYGCMINSDFRTRLESTTVSNTLFLIGNRKEMFDILNKITD